MNHSNSYTLPDIPALDLNGLHFLRMPRLSRNGAHLRALKRVDQAALANIRVPDDADGHTTQLRASPVAFQQIE